MPEWFELDSFLDGYSLSADQLDEVLSLTLSMGQKADPIRLFAGMCYDDNTTREIKSLIKHHVRYKTKKQGDVLVRRGHYTNSCFFVKGGTVAVQSYAPFHSINSLKDSVLKFFSSKSRSQENRKNKKNYAGGKRDKIRGDDQDFSIQIEEGNLAAVHETIDRVQHRGAIIAETDVELIEIRWPLLAEIIKRNREFSTYLERSFIRNALPTFLRSIYPFSQLDARSLSFICSSTTVKTFGSHEWYRKAKQGADSSDDIVTIDLVDTIVEQGDRVDNLLITWSGFTRYVYKMHNGHRLLRLQRRGQDHGMETIAKNWLAQDQGQTYKRWEVSLQSVQSTTMLYIPAIHIEEKVLPHLSKGEIQGLISRKRGTAFLNTAESHVLDNFSEEQAVQASILRFIEQHDFYNGKEAMLINLDRCVRCFDCVKACADLHQGNSVFSWHGVRQDNFMISNACMHCTDPVCMGECPTGAISRSGDQKQVLINEKTCIGCGACAHACPYNNINIMEVLVDDVDDQGKKTQKLSKKAMKCDLCVNVSGTPACQNACPHEALLRVDMLNMNSIMGWVRR